MGFSTADQMNELPMDANGNPLNFGMPTLRGGPAAYSEDLQVPGMDSPGMGGKGGVASDPAMGAQQMNIPQVPVMNPPPTGLPGLPVPVAPMTPIGPGLGNPGGPGVQPQQQIAPPAPMPPVARPFSPNMLPKPNLFAQQNRMMPGRGTQPAMPQSRIARPAPMNRGGGAGRGGMIR